MIDLNAYVMPCPFCGEKPLKTDKDGEWAHWITHKCVLDGFRFRDREAWNTRTIRPNNPRGMRLNVNIADDHISEIPEEVLNEILKPFTKGEE